MSSEARTNLNQTTILPGTIQPNVFTNLAWDNIDRLEETFTGKGTTHRVNGIVVRIYNQQSMAHICHVLSSLPS